MTERPGHCPHLGLKPNRAIRFSSPTPEHRCYVSGEAQDIPVDQANYCLSQNHVSCPLYMGLSLPSTAPSASARMPFLQGGLRGWFTSLNPRDRTIYGAVLVIVLIMVGMYLALGMQLLLPATTIGIESNPDSNSPQRTSDTGILPSDVLPTATPVMIPYE
ncbi:MAG: hypothetical protein HC837_17235 [Chloroflexaceae bacterium]|nr:hypothetical protein [Chloroflexaceae bacterium]